MKKLAAVGVLALICSACTVGGGGGGPALSASECDALIRKGWEMNSVPFDGSDEANKVFDDSVQNCTNDHKLYSRKEYDCVMSASSDEDYAKCGRGG